MIYIFDREEQFLALYSNQKNDGCPYWNAKVKEVLGGEFTFTFTIPYDHPDAKYVQELGYVAFQNYERKFQLFVVTEINEIHSGELIKEVFCEHASIELYDNVIDSMFFDRKRASDVLPMILQGTRWEVGKIENTALHDLTLDPMSVREAISNFANRWGLELEFYITITGNKITRRYVDAVQQRGYETGKRFEFRKDIEEIRREIRADQIKTALYGYGTPPSKASTREKRSTNILGSNIMNPNSVDDLVSRSWGGGWAEPSMSYDKPYGISNIDQSLLAKQASKSATRMVINHEKKKGRIIGGNLYTFSVYLKSNQSKTIGVRIEFWNNQNVRMGVDKEETFTIKANEWQRFHVQATSPAGAAYALGEAIIYSPVVGTTLQWAGAKLEVGELTAVGDPIGGEAETENKEEKMTFEEIEGYPFDDPSLPFKPKGQKYIALDSARETYGIPVAEGVKQHRFGIYENRDAKTPQELLNLTYEALSEASKPQITYTVKVVDLARILGIEAEMVHLGDRIPVIDTDLNIRITSRVIEYQYDLTIPESSEIKLGNFLPSLTSQMDEVDQAVKDAIQKNPIDIPDDILRRGDFIPTSWLEGAIEVMQNEISAGGGTVIITEDNGILIVDDPENPQKALRLLAGTIGLANERDPVTGDFNWRSFGTGEGFLSDLVETGFLRFDRSRGGTLQLGGEIIGYYEDGTPVFQNGSLVVLGSEVSDTGKPEVVVTLDGNQGGFDRLSIGILTQSQNIVTKNYQGNIDYFVDPINGNDENDGLTKSRQLKTLEEAISRIPPVNDYVINILVTLVGTEWTESPLRIEGIQGGGKIVIQLGRRNKIWTAFTITGNTNEIEIRTDYNETVSTANTSTQRAEVINQTTDFACVFCGNTVMVRIYDVVFNGNNLATRGIYAISSKVFTQYTEIYNVINFAIFSYYNSHIHVVHCSGLAGNGLIAQGGFITGGGRVPAGEEINTKTYDGGQIFGSGYTYDRGRVQPVYSPKVTSTYKANDHRSYYRSSTHNWASSEVYQGKRPTDIPVWYGVIFFNARNFSDLKNSDGSNRPITKVRLWLRRTNNTGENNPRKPKIYYNMQTSASGGIQTLYGGHWSDVSYKWGEGKYITLPNSVGEAFRDGRAKSLVLYCGSDTANYMKFMASASLEITHG